MKRILITALIALFPSFAYAQCTGQAPAHTVCGNDTGSTTIPKFTSPSPSVITLPGGTVLGNPTTVTAGGVGTIAPVLGIPGTSTGQVGLAGATSGTAILKAQAAAGSATVFLPTGAGTLASTASAPLALDSTTGALTLTGLSGGVLAGVGPAAFTRTPTLGVNGTAAGTLGFAGLTSGTVTLSPQAAAGTATLTLPNTSGTLAAGATSPLVLSSTTGVLTCPTCVTSSGGGAITGTAPISVSAGGVVSINAPYTTLTASNGGIVYSGAANLAILAGTATANQMLQSGASTTPAWSTATWPATTTINQILYSSAGNTVAGLATANSSVLVTNGSGVPSLSTTLPTVSIPLISGAVAISSNAAAALAVGANGATNPALQVDDSSASSVTGLSVKSSISGNGVILTTISTATNDGMSINAKGSGNIAIGNASTGGVSLAAGGGGVIAPALALNGCSVSSNAMCANGVVWISSTSANAFAVGANGLTNPALQVDASTASSASGLKITSKAAANGIALAAISSNANESLTIDAKGGGGVFIGSTSTGGVTLGAGGGGVNINSTIGGTAFGTNVAVALATPVGNIAGFPRIIATGTVTLGTSAISAGTCGSAATAAASNILTTDVIDAGFNTDPTAVTGYTPSAMLSLVIYPTANTVNVKQCNLTTATITPGALTLNWWVRR